MLVRVMIEEFDDNGEKKVRYILNVEFFNMFEIKIRYLFLIIINNKKFVNFSIMDVVEVIRNGN